MIARLVKLDKELFLSLNGLHEHWLNSFMSYVSGIPVWIPFYLLVLFLLYRKFGKESLWMIVAMLLCFALTDQISLHIKNAVMRLRPSHEPDLKGLVFNLKGYTGGLYGFVSSHAANTMGFAVLASLWLRNKWWTSGLVSWSILVSYSRIYLGVHYPGDILGGWILGITLAFTIHFLVRRIFLEKKPGFQKG